MYAAFRFFREFLRHPLDVSAVAPTSKAALERIVAAVPRRPGQVIVEYGPGTGDLAGMLLQSGGMGTGSQLILIEKNPVFARELGRTLHDPRVSVHCAGAAEVRRILYEHQATRADVILCSIPLSVMPEEERTHILRETSEALAEDGVFIVFLVRGVVVSFLRSFFPSVRMERIRGSLPPLTLYTVRKHIT